YAGKRPECSRDRCRRQPRFGPHGNGRKRVSDVVSPEERDFELAKRRPTPSYTEPRDPTLRFTLVCYPFDPRAGSKGFSTGHRSVRSGACTGAVAADQQESAARHKVDQAPEGEHHCVEIFVNVRVIELDVVDDGDVRKVLEKLGRLVEKGAVVLVALDDEVRPRPQAVAGPRGGEVPSNAAYEHARVSPGVGQHPADQRGGRRLAVGAGDDNGASTPEKCVAKGLGKRAVAYLPVENLLELDVAPGNGVSNNDKIQV